MRHLIILYALLCCTLQGMAQEFFFPQTGLNAGAESDSSDVRITRSYTPTTEVASQIAVGHANRLDSYLSSEKYKGTELRYISEVVRDSRKHPMTYTLTHEGELDFLKNRADNAHEISGSYDFAYSAMRRWLLLNDRLLLRAGGMADLNLGFTYNTRNSANNPAQGYASLAIGANIMAQYRFDLWGKHFRANYEARMPFVGIMFSPNYGQSYYEIFNEGNYDHNIVFTSLATFQLRQQLSLDYAVNQKLALRLGYICDIRQAEPNNIKQHHWMNAVTFGFVIKPHLTSPKGRNL